jgi:FMN phosphatase YigB (HAD superfamily)
MNFSDLLRDATRYKTLTVDIFDTVLMRKIHPEDLQFLMHAQQVKTLLAQRFGVSVDAYFLYKTRTYMRRIVDDVNQRRGADREANITQIFNAVLGAVARRFELTIRPNDRREVVNAMIALELDLEKRLLYPNKPLIRLLRRLKTRGLRIYFLSDMYLSAGHINELLVHFNVQDVFEGGFSSSDQKRSKGTGRLFRRAHERLIPGFDYVTNVHIGDNRHSDYDMPRNLGIAAIHYVTLYHRLTRRAVRRFNQLRLRFPNRSYKRRARGRLQTVLRAETNGLNRSQKALYGIGFKLAPALVNYASYLGAYAEIKACPIFLISSEGKSIGRLLRRHRFRLKLRHLPKINRINALRAFAYRSLQTLKMDLSQQLLGLFQAGEGKTQRENLLASWGLTKNNLGLSSLTLNIIDSPVLLSTAAVSGGVHDMVMGKLRRAHRRVLRQLLVSRLFWASEAILADVGWNGTIQTLIDQLIQLRRSKTQVEGIYLGSTGSNIYGLQAEVRMHGVLFNRLNEPDAKALLIEEIWEYVLSYQFKREERERDDLSGAAARLAHRWQGEKRDDPDAEKNHLIWQGIQRGLDVCLDELQIDPHTLYYVGRRGLFGLFTQPTRDEALMLGSVTHQAGFGSKAARTIFDLSLKSGYLRRMSVVNPLGLVNLIRTQYWPAGFVRWYGLGYLRPLIPVGGFIRRQWLRLRGR